MSNNIYIKPSKRGTFTTAAKARGMGVQEFASKVIANPSNYSEAMRKKAQFVKNATKFEHADGGVVSNDLPEYSVGGDTASMAGTGATIGSALGPWGTAAGAVVGGSVGFFTSNNARRKEKARRLRLQRKKSLSYRRQEGIANLSETDPTDQYTAEFADGGKVQKPYSTSTTEDDEYKRYLDSWFANRKDVLKDNLKYNSNFYNATGLDWFADSPEESIQNAKERLNDTKTYSNLTKYAKAVGKDIKEYKGKYGNASGASNYESNSVYVNPLGGVLDPGINVHAYAHASGIQQDVTNAVENIKSKYKDQENNSKLDEKEKSYYYNPREIHSRLMEIRYNNNIDPNKKVTTEDIKRFKSNNGNNELYKMYNDEAIADFLNNIVSTETQTTDIMKAANGGKVTNTENNWRLIQDPLELNTTIYKARRKYNVDYGKAFEIKNNKVAGDYIKNNYTYPYTHYYQSVDPLTNKESYIPVLTNTQLDTIAKDRGLTVLPTKHAFGGNVANPNVEVEGGESFVTPNGQNFTVDGPKHEQGGVAATLPDNTRIFSDRLKVPGTKQTFSTINKPIANKIKKFQDVLESSTNTRLAKHTADKMLTKLENKQNDLFETQQTINGNYQGGKYAEGGATGGGSGAGWGQAFGSIASIAPAIDNIISSNKVEQLNVNRYQNPYESATINKLNNRQYNISNTLASNFESFNMANRNTASAARSRGEYLSGISANYVNKATADMNARAYKQNVEAGWASETANMLANLGQQRAETNFKIEDYNARNRAAARNLRRYGISQFSSFVQNKMQQQGQQSNDQTRINLLETMFPNYQWDPNTKTYKAR